MLLNGLPGSGKSTLAGPLAAALGGLALSKDEVKEAMAPVVATKQHALLGGIAMDAIWRHAATVPGTVVIDSWWFRPRDLEFARRGVAAVDPTTCVEVWCAVPPEVARSRYEQRRRVPVHRDDRPMDATWREWFAEGRPLALWPVVIACTEVHVDVRHVAAQIGSAATAAP